RVALARALIAGPKVVFADEPTGSLDSAAGDDVMELLVNPAKQRGPAVLGGTHEPRVAGFADRTVLVRDGVESVRVNGAEGESLKVTAPTFTFPTIGCVWGS